MNGNTPLIMPLGELKPIVPASAFVAPSASIIADVRLGEHSSIWFNTVLRGDINYVAVGDYSNIQDCSVLHVADDLACIIGAYVTVGHGAILHACEVKDGCLIGMGAIVLNGAVIGEGSIVAAGSLVREGAIIPPRSLAAGNPAVVKKTLGEEESGGLRYWAEKYSRVAARYLSELSR
jgi:carbonic anhydrase/acetyltransferase-like protein (isoleucine patch superfamily)